MLAMGTRPHQLSDPTTRSKGPVFPLSVRPGQRGLPGMVAARVLDQVLDVVADLPDVVPHRQLDVAVPLPRAPEEVLALAGAVDPAGGVHRGQRVLVAEDDGHGDADLAEAALEVVPGAVA